MSEAELDAGLRTLGYEALFANMTGALTSGVVMAAFALHLGASNTVIGLLAAAPFLTQALQAPAVLLIENLRMRKAISVIAALAGRSALAVMAVLALFPAWAGAEPLLTLAQFVLCALGAIGGCAWNAWVRDLVPPHRLGEVLARRTAYATGASLIAGLVAAVALDQAATGGMRAQSLAFAALYAAGFLASLVSAWLTARIPEPAMPAATERPQLTPLLTAPLRDANFRNVLVFLGCWHFAANLATPFFTVYFLEQLDLTMTGVMALTIVSQLTNLAALSTWGFLGDRFSNKSVLAAAAPALILCIAAMAGASQFANADVRLAYLFALHALMGLATAGVTLAAANIVLKLSPTGRATAYVATAALTTAGSAGLAPVVGGLFADFFAARGLQLTVNWSSPEGLMSVAALNFSNWDFYFIGATLIGFYALHRLAFVREEGEIDPRAMREQIALQLRRSVRNMSPVAGFKALMEVPTGLFREQRILERLQRRRQRAQPPSG